MRTKLNYIYITIIIILFVLIILGHQLNKKSSSSKKNEILNLTKQIITKSNQLSKIQKNLLSKQKNINDLIDPKNINFTRVINEKKLDDFYNLKFSKYRTDEILFSGNFGGQGTAYIDFFNNDRELILATVDGIFAFADINNLKNFFKISSNFSDLVTYSEFYTDFQYGIKDILIHKNQLFVSLIGEKKKRLLQY